MTLGTHVAFASVLYLGGATLFGYRPDWISWALAAAASLLPDIDLPPARIGRLFWFVSVPLERRFGHRTLTHSALMLLAVAALAAPLQVGAGRPGGHRLFSLFGCQSAGSTAARGVSPSFARACERDAPSLSHARPRGF